MFIAFFQCTLQYIYLCTEIQPRYEPSNLLFSPHRQSERYMKEIFKSFIANGQRLCSGRRSREDAWNSRSRHAGINPSYLRCREVHSRRQPSSGGRHRRSRSPCRTSPPGTGGRVRWVVNSMISIIFKNFNLTIFGGLVLGCIKTKFARKYALDSIFSSSTRFAYLCTAAISIFSFFSISKF